MKNTSKERFVSDIDMHDTNVMARKPFKVTAENVRRFVRLEIASPITISVVKDSLGNFNCDGGDLKIDGIILNISPGGMLVAMGHPLAAGDIVLMSFSLQDIETLDDVLGIVKRVEKDGDSYMDGIEFITRTDLEDRLTTAELDLLTDKASHFEDKVQEMLQRYLYHKQDSQQE